VLFVVVDQAGAKGWDTSKFPGHIVYPTQLYKTTQFMASGPPVKEGAQPGLGDYSHLPRGYTIVRSAPMTSTTTTANRSEPKPAQKRSRATTAKTTATGTKTLKQTKLSFAAGTRSMPQRTARRDAVVDLGDNEIDREFDEYESEQEYDAIDANTALVVVSSPATSPGPLSENTMDSPARKRKVEKAPRGEAAMNQLDMAVDPDEKRSRRRRK